MYRVLVGVLCLGCAGLVWADDQPRKLVRKSDGVIVGAGYSSFKNHDPALYDVEVVTTEALPGIMQEINQRRQVELDAQKIQLQAEKVKSESDVKAALSLTNEEFADLKKALGR